MKLIKRVTETLLIASGVVFFWRGAWGLMDLYIHPSNPLLSYLISVGLGIGILSFTHQLHDSLK